MENEDKMHLKKKSSCVILSPWKRPYSHFLQTFNPSKKPAGSDLIINDGVVNIFVGEKDQHGKTFPIWQLEHFSPKTIIFHHVKLVLYEHHWHPNNAIVVNVKRCIFSEIRIKGHLPGTCSRKIKFFFVFVFFTLFPPKFKCCTHYQITQKQIRQVWFDLPWKKTVLISMSRVNGFRLEITSPTLLWVFCLM